MSIGCSMAEVFYSREQIERWQKTLEEIAQQPRTSFAKKQVVEELIDTIEKALLNRSYDEVANGLKDWGLDISAGSLRQHVTRYRRTHSNKGRSAKKPAAKKQTAQKQTTQKPAAQKRTTQKTVAQKTAAKKRTTQKPAAKKV